MIYERLQHYPEVLKLEHQKKDENGSAASIPYPHKRAKPPTITRQRLASKKVGGDLLSRGCAVPSARLGLTSLFGMGRGDPQRYNHQNIGWTTLSLKY